MASISVLPRFFISVMLLTGFVTPPIYAARLLQSTAHKAPVMAPVIEGVRVWDKFEYTRVVFDLSAPVNHKAFHLYNPNRLVIDLATATLNKPLHWDATTAIVKQIRHSAQPGAGYRLVIDLFGPVKPKSYMLAPHGEQGHRLVVDLYGKKKMAERSHVEPIQHIQPAEPEKISPDKTPGEVYAKIVAVEDEVLADFVVAIDPGHGGDDPGALGHLGTLEKFVVLDIARTLQQLINAEVGFKAILTRENDATLNLRQRMQVARHNKAQVFVSIHADSARNRYAQGSSVYALSQKGASDEAARWLAEKQNASDLIGGVRLGDKDNLLASVILDLSQTATLEASLDLGEQVLSALKKTGKTHGDKVKQAGFVVLKSPDIPSILVETAYISNVSDEKKLLNKQHQNKLAQAVLEGIKQFAGKNDFLRPKIMKAMSHIIAPGETLASIAKQYSVSMQRLKQYNRLQLEALQAGQVIRIPLTGS